MARIVFTANLARHLPVPEVRVDGPTLRAVLDGVFAVQPLLKGYVLDDEGRVRQHVAVFVDGRQIADRGQLDVPLGPDSEVYILQALSGG